MQMGRDTGMEFLQPPDWPRAKGYSNGISARGRLVFVAGEIGWNPVTETIETDNFTAQFRQALENIKTILAEAQADPTHVVRMTWFITSKAEYLAQARDVGRAYRDVFGKHYPAMAVVAVSALMEDRAKVEIEATAVIPD